MGWRDSAARYRIDLILFSVSLVAYALSSGSMLAQQPLAEAVKGRDPRLAVLVVETGVDPACDLAGCTGGKGEHEDLIAPGDALLTRSLRTDE